MQETILFRQVGYTGEHTINSSIRFLSLELMSHSSTPASQRTLRKRSSRTPRFFMGKRWVILTWLYSLLRKWLKLRRNINSSCSSTIRLPHRIFVVRLNGARMSLHTAQLNLSVGSEERRV